MMRAGTIQSGTGKVRQIELDFLRGIAILSVLFCHCNELGSSIVLTGGGAKLVIINKAETSYDANADVVIHRGAGAVMDRIVTVMQQLDAPCA